MAYTYNLHVEAGATFSRDMVYINEDGSAFNLTGYSAKLQIRPTVSSVTLTLEVIPTITVLTSTISWQFTAVQTALLTGGVYAVELTNGTTVIRLIEGSVIVSPEVVR